MKEKLESRYGYFMISSIIYGFFFTFCLYRNLHGITLPFWVAGKLVYFILAFRQLELKIKKDTVFYAAAALLLGISSVLTDDPFLHFFNMAGILLLLGVSLLHQMYEERKWGFGRFIMNISTFFWDIMESIALPFSQTGKFFKKKSGQENKKLKYVLLGILIALPLFLIIVLMLVSADRIFYEMVSKALSYIRIDMNIVFIICMIFLGIILIYAAVGGLVNYRLKEDQPACKNQEPIIAITFTSILCAVYLIFCGIQVVYLFAQGVTGLPGDFTYAEYARRGFFELLFVSILNFAMVIICNTFFRDHKALKVLLTIISVCNYILIASSIYRMILYVAVYHLTYLRVLVLWFLILLAFFMAGALICVYRSKFRLFFYCMIVLTIGYLGFSFARPDYLIANYNLAHMEVMHIDDIHYLMNSLSDDAAPAIAKLDPENIEGASRAYSDAFSFDAQQTRKMEFYDYFYKLDEKYQSSWRKYNFSEHKAQIAAVQYLEKHEEDKKLLKTDFN